MCDILRQCIATYAGLSTQYVQVHFGLILLKKNLAILYRDTFQDLYVFDDTEYKLLILCNSKFKSYISDVLTVEYQLCFLDVYAERKCLYEESMILPQEIMENRGLSLESKRLGLINDQCPIYFCVVLIIQSPILVFHVSVFVRPTNNYAHSYSIYNDTW